MSTTVEKIPEEQGMIGYKKPPVATRFKKGESGNPGGVKKGATFIGEAYKRILALKPEKREAFKPKNVAEEIAIAQVERALTAEAQHANNVAKEIADRTEGKALQRIGSEDGEPMVLIIGIATEDI